MPKPRTRAATLVALGLLAAAGVATTQPASHSTHVTSTSHAIKIMSRPTLTLEGAHYAVVAGLDEADRLDAGGAIAVVDDGGSLLCLMRRDGTFPAAAEVALEKARTAARFKHHTKDFEDAIKNGRTPLLGVSAMTPLEGGVLIIVDGQVVGAVGVSGAHSSTEDVRIATYAADALSKALNPRTDTAQGDHP